MAFDWPRFLDQHNIEYLTSGPSVSKGNVAIHCPFCGDEDPSHHMGISLNGRGWGCWRKPDHRGRSAARLVQALLHCSMEQALRIVGDTTFIPEDFLGRVQQAVSPLIEAQDTSRVLELPEEFKPFKDLPSARPFVNYLKRRDFADDDIWSLTDRFDIRYCTRGPYRGRIIFPVHDSQGALVSWTGRAIDQRVELRYKTLSNDREKAEAEGSEPALAPINHYVLWQDLLFKSDKIDDLFVHEGPFDALKTAVLGRRHFIGATALFRSHATAEQLDVLHELLPRFRGRHILLDRGMFASALKLAADLVAVGNVDALSLPDYRKDPGENQHVGELLDLIT